MSTAQNTNNTILNTRVKCRQSAFRLKPSPARVAHIIIIVVIKVRRWYARERFRDGIMVEWEVMGGTKKNGISSFSYNIFRAFRVFTTRGEVPSLRDSVSDYGTAERRSAVEARIGPRAQLRRRPRRRRWVSRVRMCTCAVSVCIGRLSVAGKLSTCCIVVTPCAAQPAVCIVVVVVVIVVVVCRVLSRRALSSRLSHHHPHPPTV